jgi:hypothetical protein
VPSSATGSVLESMPRSVLENVLGVLGSVLGVYWGASSELIWELISLPVTGFGPIDGPAFKIHIAQPQSSQMPLE